MARFSVLFLVLIGWFPVSSWAQVPSDTLRHPTAPVFLQASLYFPLQLVGAQLSIGRLVAQTERHTIEKTGSERVVFKDRIVCITPGFYRQKYLHTNLFLSVEYAFVRRHPSGMFTQFVPFAGVSRTFLTDAVYTVDANGMVQKEASAGDWRAMAGFSVGLGRRFDTHKAGLPGAIYLTVNVPFFYPNFRSVAIKPTVQLGVAFNLNRLSHSYANTLKTIHR